MKASRGKSPAPPVKPATPPPPPAGADKGEMVVERAVKTGDSPTINAHKIAEAFPSPDLIKKLTKGDKLTHDEQRTCAQIYKAV